MINIERNHMRSKCNFSPSLNDSLNCERNLIYDRQNLLYMLSVDGFRFLTELSYSVLFVIIFFSVVILKQRFIFEYVKPPAKQRKY